MNFIDHYGFVVANNSFPPITPHSDMNHPRSEQKKQ